MWDFKLKRTRIIFVTSLIWIVILFLLDYFGILDSTTIWIIPVLIYWVSPVFIKWIKLIISWVGKGD